MSPIKTIGSLKAPQRENHNERTTTREPQRENHDANLSIAHVNTKVLDSTTKSSRSHTACLELFVYEGCRSRRVVGQPSWSLRPTECDDGSIRWQILRSGQRLSGNRRGCVHLTVVDISRVANRKHGTGWVHRLRCWARVVSGMT